MNKPIISEDFTNDDIHNIREYNFEITKNMSPEDKLDYYNKKGLEAKKKIDEIRSKRNVVVA